MASPAAISRARSPRRRVGVVGASLGLHAVILLAFVALGHRATLHDETPPGVEMLFDAPAVADPAPETATVSEAPVAPAVAPEPAAQAAIAEPPPTPLVVADVPPLAPDVVEPVAPPAELPPPIAASIPVAPAAPSRPAPKRMQARAPVVDHAVARLPTIAGPEPPPTARSMTLATVVPARPSAPQASSISARWQGALASWIRARTRYPEAARRLGEEGAVVVSFTVGRDGQVLDALLKQRSGSDTLDQAALAMFHAARVPAFPADMEQAQVTISVPVRYRLED